MSLTRKQKKGLIQLGISLFIYLLLGISKWKIFPENESNQIVYFILYFALYLYIGWKILKKSWMNILAGDFLDENFLMSIASLGAFLLGEESEAIAVVWFYLLGEWFQSYALTRSRKNIASLMDIRPDFVRLVVDGKEEETDPELAEIGQEMIILPGERIALDGIVLEGSSSLDTAALTGESVPRKVGVGDEVISGCINENGRLLCRITSSYENSTVSKILDLVENATNKKSRSEQFITRFARVYTPTVVFLALAIALIPSLITGNWNDWVYRALEFLVISCPCALVVSVPLSFFAGIGAASKAGVLFKGSNYLQQITQIAILVVDKTGTITKGVFEVTNVQSLKMDSQDLINLAASLEKHSTHPMARAVVKASMATEPVLDVQEIAGEGMSGVINGKRIACGNQKLMNRFHVPESELLAVSDFVSPVYVAYEGEYLGCLELSDVLKDDVKTVFDLLKRKSVQKVVMLSGDQPARAKSLAKLAGVDEVHAGLLPDEKVAWLERIMKENPGKLVAFVGDGINDAPSLVRSDLGIAMGSLGSDAAIEAADVVLMNDQLDSLITAFSISSKTMSIVRFNIAFAIGIKILFLVLGAFGLASMWAAVFADVGVTFICVLNALRALKSGNLNVNRA